mgnify:CR=1 FL=1
MPRAGYGDLEVGSETSAPQAVHPVGSAAAPGIAFSTDTDLGLYRHAANELGLSAGGTAQSVASSGALTFLLSTNISASSGTLTVTSPTIVTPTIAATGWSNANHTHAGATTGGTLGAVSEVSISANNSTDETVYPVFVDGATGDQGLESDTGLSYNPSSGVLTTTSVTGNLTGNVTGDVTGTTSLVTVSANNTTNETVYPIFVDGATGSQGIESDTGLTYNPSTGTLTATTFVGTAGKSVGFILAMS